MKKTTKILFAISIALSAISLNAQNNCNVLCHNGTLLSGVNDNAVQGHLNHGDIYIANDCDYTEIGNECESLSLPKFSFKQPYPENVNYVIYDVAGKTLRKGKTYKKMEIDLPTSQVLFIRVDGYKILRIIK